MRIALFFQDGGFVGREYFSAVTAAGFSPALVVAAGRMKAESVAIEAERTGGLWSPPPIPMGAVTHRFDQLADPAIARLLSDAKIDVAVQGGIGILKGALLAAPRSGWLNVHPGKLPQYRGNACPEWAVLSGDQVIATAHFLDDGIDTGPVICEERYEVGAGWSYFEFRANLYRHCARVLVQALDRLERAGERARDIAQPQAEEGARYWPPLTERDRVKVRRMFAPGGNRSR
jgi:methionyl-tRNA formyltransferase